MLLQLLINVYHVLDTKLKQKERSDYISYYNIIIDEVYEDEHNIIHDNMKIKKAQLINNKDIKNNNILITLFEFINLLILSKSDNLDSLQQIHNHICQSLNKVQNAEQNTLDRTTYKIQSNQEHDFYIFMCHDSKFLE